MSAPADPTAPGSRRQFLLVWLAVTGVLVLAHFTFFRNMGLYEDDHWLIGVPMCQWRSVDDLSATIKAVFASPAQGRPFCFTIGFSFAYLSTHAAGMLGAYALAATVWAANAGLCLALLWRRFGAVAATSAALVFVLVPADTTHPLLHSALYVHPSVTFLLLSGIAYSHRWRILSVVLSAGALLTYETCFLPALVWPLLFPDPTRALWRRVLVHGVAMGLVLAGALYLRVQTGEDRVAGAMSDKAAVVKKVRELALAGPKAALRTFVTRPVSVAKSWRSSAAFTRPGPSRRTVVAYALGGGFFALLALMAAGRVRRPPGVPGAADPTAPAPASGPPSADPPPAELPVVRLIVAGALMAVLGYVAALNREPQIISGRMSSVHIGATLGWGLFVGGLVAGTGRLLVRARAGWLLPPAFAAYVCLLAGFHVFVQREYVRAWIAQREFWQDVLAECPDARSGTIILYPLVPPVSEMVHYQEWADHMTFGHLFAVPADWGVPPRAFPVGHLTWGVPRDYKDYNWNEVEREGDRLYWKHWDGNRPVLEPGNVILLRRGPDGRFERITGTVRMAGVDLPLKPREGPEFSFEPNKLYPVMFPAGTAPVAANKARVSR